MTTQAERTIRDARAPSVRSALLRWEFLLLALLAAINVMNVSISANYLQANNLFTAINSFLIKGFIAMPMAYLLVMGNIDLSVGSTVALSATLLGITYNAGLPMGWAIVVALLCGTACGALNGLILTRFTELAPMIVTLGTMTLYRGIAEMILGSQSTGGFHNVGWFYQIYYARLGAVPWLFLFFCLLALLFGLVLHRTIFGRHLYAIGSNRLTARYSGVPVQRIRFIAYTLMGLVCGMGAVFYASWTGTVRYDIAAGYELEAISVAVLGGISTAGGKGTFPGAIISIFIIGLLRYGLGLVNVNSQTILMIIGVILIAVVLAPNLRFARRKPAAQAK
ncbi:MAG TPA: ABC transporter permease [Candidatus Limnocylindria bacterium]|nr:ABC transporter permease [Candidatus Limnocylindria bacterium]